MMIHILLGFISFAWSVMYCYLHFKISIILCIANLIKTSKLSVPIQRENTCKEMSHPIYLRKGRSISNHVLALLVKMELMSGNNGTSWKQFELCSLNLLFLLLSGVKPPTSPIHFYLEQHFPCFNACMVIYLLILNYMFLAGFSLYILCHMIALSFLVRLNMPFLNIVMAKKDFYDRTFRPNSLAALLMLFLVNIFHFIPLRQIMPLYRYLILQGLPLNLPLLPLLNLMLLSEGAAPYWSCSFSLSNARIFHHPL